MYSAWMLRLLEFNLVVTYCVVILYWGRFKIICCIECLNMLYLDGCTFTVQQQMLFPFLQREFNLLVLCFSEFTKNDKFWLNTCRHLFLSLNNSTYLRPLYFISFDFFISNIHWFLLIDHIRQIQRSLLSKVCWNQQLRKT